MSSNGDKKEILTITHEKGKMFIHFGTDVPLALVSHALRLASLQLDNAIIGMTQEKSQIEIPSSIIQKLRGN